MIDFQQSFRLEGIPDNMYDTDYADDTEAITWCVMGGQLGPVPLKKGGRKHAVGGMRQRIEWLGGLRCIIAERDEGSDEPPVLVVVLAHGINGALRAPSSHLHFAREGTLVRACSSGFL